MNENKERLTYRPEPETRRKIEKWCGAANCRSMNEFVDRAVNFYADYIAANDNNTLLPSAIISAMNGRLGMMEKNLAAMSFKHAVELDMLVGIISDAYQFDRDDLKRRRAQSVKNVKATNGLISLEKRARIREEQDWDDDEWQD